MQVVVSNISVEVIRKNIKNMHLAVLPPDGRVRVSAPTQLTSNYDVCPDKARLDQKTTGEVSTAAASK